MKRFFLEISFDGTPFHGWQRQRSAITVQQVVEDALSLVARHPVGVYGCGRTDAGVHAAQFFLHFETEAAPSADWVRKLNRILPPEVAAHQLYALRRPAHARFDAYERTYEYHIVRRKSPFLQRRAVWVHYPLDLSAMNAAARRLLDFDDFEAVSKTDGKGNHTVDLRYAAWDEVDGRIIFTITANRFLRGMVRLIVGNLIDVGRGKKTPDEFADMLAARRRELSSPLAPPHGLYLTRIRYPHDLLIPLE